MTDVPAPPGPAALAGLLAHYAAGGRLALLFDYDGTLTPIVGHPDEAQLSDAVRRLLADFRDLPGVFVGILSGRRLDEVREMVGLPGLYYAGTAGLELEFPSGRIDHPQADEARRLAEKLAERLDPLAAACPGARIERKPLGMTVHYRGADPETADDLVRRVSEELRPMADQLRVLYGPKAIEVTPALGWTKATALERIVEAAGTAGLGVSGPGPTAGSGAVGGLPAGAAIRTLPLYAGDSENDADALASAERLGGVGLGVGPAAPLTAGRRISDPAALAQLLTAFFDKLRDAVPGQHER